MFITERTPPPTVNQMVRLVKYSKSSTDLVCCDICQVIRVCVLCHGKNHHSLDRRAVCWAEDGLSVKINMKCVVCLLSWQRTLTSLLSNKPAHHGCGFDKPHLVLVRGGQEELFRGKGGVPRHARWHGSLLDAHGAQDEKIVHCALLQVILYLGLSPKWMRTLETWHLTGTGLRWTDEAHQHAVHSQWQQSGSATVWVDTKKKVSDGLVMGAVPADVRPVMMRFFFSLQAEHSHGIPSILTGDKENL